MNLLMQYMQQQKVFFSCTLSPSEMNLVDNPKAILFIFDFQIASFCPKEISFVYFEF